MHAGEVILGGVAEHDDDAPVVVDASGRRSNSWRISGKVSLTHPPLAQAGEGVGKEDEQGAGGSGTGTEVEVRTEES